MNHKAKAAEFEAIDYRIQVTGRHVEVTDAIRDYAIEKISKLERFINRIIDVNVIIHVQKLDHHVEIVLKAGHLKITSQASSTDMYASIDKAVARLEAQLLRYKSKLQDHHAKGHAVLDMSVDVIEAPFEEEFFELNGTSEKQRVEPFVTHRVVKKDTLPLKTLNLDEAVMKMELSRDAFMLFKNEATQKLNAIYRRDDGHYGIVEPSC